MQIMFETPRLLVRRFTMDDGPLLYRFNSVPAVIKYVHEPVLESEAEATIVLRDIILPQYDRNLGRWALQTKAGNDFIGWCGLKYLIETGEIDLGYRLLPGAWGKGYATEAARHTLTYGFHQLGLETIFAKAHIENIASINVLQKIGMQFIKDEPENDYLVKTFVAHSITELKIPLVNNLHDQL